MTFAKVWDWADTCVHFLLFVYLCSLFWRFLTFCLEELVDLCGQGVLKIVAASKRARQSIHTWFAMRKELHRSRNATVAELQNRVDALRECLKQAHAELHQGDVSACHWQLHRALIRDGDAIEAKEED